MRHEIERLVREHHSIEALMVMLDSHFAAMKAGDEVDEQLLLDAMSYLTEFSDGCHHAKEDLAIEVASELAPELPGLRAACGEIQAQHRRIREAGAALRDGLQRALLDAPVSRRCLADSGFSYTAEVRRNMATEESSLFPALLEALDAQAWARIDAKLGPCDDPLFGETVHQRYKDLFRSLTSRFGAEGIGYE